MDTATFSMNTAIFRNDYSEPGDFARIITQADPTPAWNLARARVEKDPFSSWL